MITATKRKLILGLCVPLVIAAVMVGLDGSPATRPASMAELQATVGGCGNCESTNFCDDIFCTSTIWGKAKIDTHYKAVTGTLQIGSENRDCYWTMEFFAGYGCTPGWIVGTQVCITFK